MTALIWRCRRCGKEGVCEIERMDFPHPVHQCDPSKPLMCGYMELIGRVYEEDNFTQRVVNHGDVPVPVIKG